MTDITQRLLKDAIHHRQVAEDCDCRPQDTVNMEHHDNCLEAVYEIERLRDGIQRVIDGTYGRDKHFETKHDTCPHGQFSWQSCDPCVDEYLASLLEPVGHVGSPKHD